MSAVATTIETANGDWHPRLPKNSPALRRHGRNILLVTFGIAIIAVIVMSLLNKVHRRLTFLPVILIVPIHRHFNRRAAKNRKLLIGDPSEPIFDLDHDATRDEPVLIEYHLDGVLLGDDQGWLSRRADGVTFTGMETAFRHSFKDAKIFRVRVPISDRKLRATFPVGDLLYSVTLKPVFQTGSLLDPDPVRNILVEADPDAPAASVFDPLPVTSSPSRRKTPARNLALLWTGMLAIPLALGGVLWTTGPALFAAAIALLVLITLLVVGLKFIQPRLIATRVAILRLDERAHEVQTLLQTSP